MAELWKLPVVYIIEYNQYAMGTSVARSSALTDFSKRGVSFNIPGVSVDGMDVEAVQAAGAEAMAFCRSGKGPIILEMKTYRYRGHSMSDPAKYRSREEVTEVREKRDPIEHFGQKLVKNGVASEDDLKMIDKDVRAVVTQAAEFATESPEPGPAELYTDVLA
jgi:pyruvate dehydrogenase E1 component alpha subunit